MRSVRYILTLILFSLVLNLSAQSSHDDVLFTVDSEPVYASEFLRIYNKNLDLVQDESQKNVDSYLELFTDYKLKLKEARALGLDKKPSYVKEFQDYKKQLAENYLTDNEVSDALVKEAYDRLYYEVEANHILVRVAENASPADTLTAYNEIIKLRDRAVNEGFEKVRKEVHNGKTIYGEELGYFTGFRMVYSFENVAYNTAVGATSKPFRTRFGYHILKVLDKRKARGERTVAHIMIMNKDSSSVKQTEERANAIYQKITQGEDFESLAKQFSDDKSSASKGGIMAPFSGGQLGVKKFEDVAFSLNKVGDVSQPFQTQYGWHIIKLYNIKPVASFEAMQPELVNKVKRDDRSKIIDEALFIKLKQDYNIPETQPAIAYFVSILNDDYYKGSWRVPNSFKANMSLVKIGDIQLLYKDFGEYLFENQRNTKTGASFNTIVETKYRQFLEAQLIDYKESHLEEENLEYAYILNEYREGVLLFELMETTIWKSSETDSLEVQAYYRTHKSDYLQPQKVDVVVASSLKKKTIKKVSKLLDQGLEVDKIATMVNTNDVVDVILTTEIMEKGHQALPDDFDFKMGISKIYKHNEAYLVAQVKEVFPQTQKTFEESKGAVISDYQSDKEKKWMNTLKEKYKIVVNQDVLNHVKSEIKSQ